MAVACSYCKDTGWIIYVHPVGVRGKTRSKKIKCKHCNGPTPKDK